MTMWLFSIPVYISRQSKAESRYRPFSRRYSGENKNKQSKAGKHSGFQKRREQIRKDRGPKSICRNKGIPDVNKKNYKTTL